MIFFISGCALSIASTTISSPASLPLASTINIAFSVPATTISIILLLISSYVGLTIHSLSIFAILTAPIGSLNGISDI